MGGDFQWSPMVIAACLPPVIFNGRRFPVVTNGHSCVLTSGYLYKEEVSNRHSCVLTSGYLYGEGVSSGHQWS